MFRHLLVREIGVWLAIKVAALTAIFLLFFGSEQHLDVFLDQADAYDVPRIPGASAVPGANPLPVRLSID